MAAIVTSPWFIAQSAYFRRYIMACYEIPKVFSPPEDGLGSGLFDILADAGNRNTRYACLATRLSQRNLAGHAQPQTTSRYMRPQRSSGGRVHASRCGAIAADAIELNGARES